MVGLGVGDFINSLYSSPSPPRGSRGIYRYKSSLSPKLFGLQIGRVKWRLPTLWSLHVRVSRVLGSRLRTFGERYDGGTKT